MQKNILFSTILVLVLAISAQAQTNVPFVCLFGPIHAQVIPTVYGPELRRELGTEPSVPATPTPSRVPDSPAPKASTPALPDGVAIPPAGTEASLPPPPPTNEDNEKNSDDGAAQAASETTASTEAATPQGSAPEEEAVSASLSTPTTAELQPYTRSLAQLNARDHLKSLIIENDGWQTNVIREKIAAKKHSRAYRQAMKLKAKKLKALQEEQDQAWSQKWELDQAERKVVKLQKTILKLKDHGLSAETLSNLVNQLREARSALDQQIQVTQNFKITCTCVAAD